MFVPQFDDVPCATKALNDLYGHTLNGLVKGGIRLSFSKNPLGVRTASVSNGPNNLAASANLFNAALAGLQEGRFGSGHQGLPPTRHASLSAHTFGSEIMPRVTRQESVDVLSSSAFGSFGLGSSRPFSPPSYNQQQQQPLRPQPFLSQQPSSHSHQSLIDGLSHFNAYVDPRDPHGVHNNPTHSTSSTILSASPQPGVEA